jgi:hypothetical protein
MLRHADIYDAGYHLTPEAVTERLGRSTRPAPWRAGIRGR